MTILYTYILVLFVIILATTITSLYDLTISIHLKVRLCFHFALRVIQSLSLIVIVLFCPDNYIAPCVLTVIMLIYLDSDKIYVALTVILSLLS